MITLAEIPTATNVELDSQRWLIETYYPEQAELLAAVEAERLRRYEAWKARQAMPHRDFAMLAGRAGCNAYHVGPSGACLNCGWQGPLAE